MTDTIYTPETLAAHFGYNVEAMRGIWRRCPALDERGFARNMVLDTDELTALLSEIAGSRRRTDEVRASAQTLADTLSVRLDETSVGTDAASVRDGHSNGQTDAHISQFFKELETERSANGQTRTASTDADGRSRTLADNPNGQTDAHGQSAQAETDTRTWEQKVADELRAQRFKREEEAREKFEAEQAAKAVRAKRLRPYLNFLTWGLNVIEMAFVVVGLTTLGGLLGFLVGVMVVFLGCYILLVISDPDSVEVGENAVWVWLVICIITGYFIEWPAAQYYFAHQYFRLPVSLETYAAMIAVLVSGSSFVGTYLRWKKSSLEN